MKLPFNVKFREAAKFFSRKVPLSRTEFDQLADWAKLRAFTVAHVARAELLQDIMDAVREAIESGLTMADFNAALDEIMQAKGWTGLRPWHAETVFRTNVQSAYGSGQLEQQRAQRDDFPFLQYWSIEDERRRRLHAAYHAMVFAIGDPRLRRIYPPWDFNCRCWMESLTAEEAREIGIRPVNIIDDGQSGGFTSPGASDVYEPDLRGLDPELAAKVREAMARFDPNAIDD